MVKCRIVELGVVTDFPRLVERLVKTSRLPAILDSSLYIGELGETSFLACEPFLTISSRGEENVIMEGNRRTIIRGNPFDVLRGQLQRFRIEQTQDARIFPCGAIGYFGYGLRHFLERLPQRVPDDIPGGGLPDMFFAFYDGMLAVDVRSGRARLIQVDFGSMKHARWETTGADVLEEVGRRFAVSGGEQETWATGGKNAAGNVTVGQGTPAVFSWGDSCSISAHANFTRGEYERAVRKAIEYIFAGDIFQVNLSQRFAFSRSGSGRGDENGRGGHTPVTDATLVDLFLRLREASPAPFSCLLDIGQGRGVVSTSPERFLRIRGRYCESRPIKGTRRRGATPEEDEALRRELIESEKDAAELAMIVDLERNDLGKVCEYGSVRVREKKRLESYATVHHLVGVVEGKLRDRHDSIDAIQAMFPCGSITGAPKIRAMEIIEELELSQRGVYTGAIGYLGFDGSVDLSVAIRIVQVTPRMVFYHVGGGIVADSDPAAEYEETLVKGAALGRVLTDCGIVG